LLAAVSQATEIFMSRTSALIVLMAGLTGCAALDSSDPSNLAAYCTAENAFRLGAQGRAYFGVCPKDSESAFLAGLARGRQLLPPTPQAFPYYAQIEELEKQLAAATNDADRRQLRERLSRAEWWAMEILRNPGSPAMN
jgi:hypothetical protein